LAPKKKDTKKQGENLVPKKHYDAVKNVRKKKV